MIRKTAKYLLVAVITIPMITAGLSAQDYQLKKWVIGSGGMVMLNNADNMKMCGLVGQVAIEKVSNTVDGDLLDVYQGFWVPDGMFWTDIPPGLTPEQARLTNFPNPFNLGTTISYTLPSSAYITLSIYDVAGNLVKSIFSGIQEGGSHELKWDSKNMSGNDVVSGSYVYELTVRSVQTGSTLKPYSLQNVMVLIR